MPKFFFGKLQESKPMERVQKQRFSCCKHRKTLKLEMQKNKIYAFSIEFLFREIYGWTHPIKRACEKSIFAPACSVSDPTFFEPEY